MASEPGRPALSSNEKLIQRNPASDELAWRNVNPNHHRDGALTSQVYDPSPADQGLRSTARESVVDAATHYDEFTQKGNASDGVCGVGLSGIESVGLRWIDDSYYVNDVTGHASIDFRTPDPAKQSRRQIKKLARDLAKLASWHYCES